MGGFSSVVHLIGRHPKLVRNDEFVFWISKHGGEVWHETHRSEQGTVTVVVQSLDRFHLFAALVNFGSGGASLHNAAEVVRTVRFDLSTENSSSKHAAFALMHEIALSSEQLQSIRPVINFGVEPAQLGWEIEVLRGSHVEVYRIDRDNKIDLFDTRILQPLSDLKGVNLTPLLGLPSDDWLERNELHHPELFLDEALKWTAGSTTITEKAKRIWLNVSKSYAYVDTIRNIDKFTFADVLIRDRLGRAGVCDEFAVIQVSYLRALGIPAVIKFLTFRFGGQLTAHACSEFLNDEGRWVHMDSLYADAFDLPSVYRRCAAKDVKVMDANFPSDTRSSKPAWGVQDPLADLQLNPYTDFILTPCYPGNDRAGYSY